MSKRIVGIVFCVFVITMSLIDISSATCFSTEFKLEHGQNEKNIQAILDYGNCEKKENKDRVGKWFCYVAKMVGIDAEDDKKIKSGNFTPSTEKFFVTITEINDDDKRIACDWGEFGLAYNLGGFYTNHCLANYKITVSDVVAFFNESTDGHHFVSDHTNFTLTATNNFVMFRNEGKGTSYVSHGKCEKIQ
jgi:hypothetical protein